MWCVLGNVLVLFVGVDDGLGKLDGCDVLWVCNLKGCVVCFVVVVFVLVWMDVGLFGWIYVGLLDDWGG